MSCMNTLRIGTGMRVTHVINIPVAAFDDDLLNHLLSKNHVF